MSVGSVVRLVVGIVLLPFCYAAAMEFGGVMLRTGEGLDLTTLWCLVGGVGVYVVLFLFFHKTMATWVFGRATVERAWGTITGFRRLDAETEDGGKSATMTDAQGRPVPVWRMLLPYVVPLHTVVAVLVVCGVNYFVGMREPTYMRIQAFVVGITFTFHLFMLFHDVREKRTDVRAVGYVFTLVLVFLVNVEILALLGWLVFKEGDWIEFNRAVLAGSQNPYRMAFDWIRSLIG